MYRKARVKLTIIYFLIFLFIFASLSLGIYFWFKGSLGKGYITEVKQIHQNIPLTEEFGVQHVQIVTIAGSVALKELGQILILLNIIVIFIIPILGWFLTRRTLDPIQKTFEQQRQFVSDTSHELRTPLSVLSGEMEVTLRKKRTPDYYRRVMMITKEEVDNLTKLVQNLLFLARSDQKRHEYNFEDVDITDLLGQVITEQSRFAKEKKIFIKFKPEEKASIVKGQTTMLKTLFSNLISNAIKYNKLNGKLWVEIKSTSNNVLVNIKDNGIGISKDDINKIFDRFYRSDLSRSETKGFGLGLSIVKSIVDFHRGKISVKSELGKGSVFRISLPKS